MGDVLKKLVPIFWVFGVVVFPNILFGLLSLYFGLGRPYVNFDYLVCAVIFFTPLRFLFYPLVLVCAFFDVMLLVCQVFPFVRLQDVFYLLGFIPAAALAWQAWLCVSVVLALFAFGLFSLSVRRSSLLSCLVLLNFSLLLYAFSVYGTDVDRGKFWRVPEGRAVSSQAVYFYTYRQGAFLEKYFEEGEPFSKAAYSGATEPWFEAGAGFKNKVLLIVNESWGATLNPQIVDQLIRPLRELKNIDAVEYGSKDFVGATVAGELRELCRLQPNHFNLSSVSEGFDACLPGMFKYQGYVTHAMHGAVGLMYDRVHWYSKIGFDERVFFESRSWKERCYSFPGACDLELMEEQLKPLLARNGKDFIYWLTLNTHSYYDVRDLRGDYFNCAEYGVLSGGEACRNLKLQAQFFKGLADVLSGVGSGVDVVVVGDHSPPMFDQREKGTVFLDSKVSYIRFSVR
ncbi:sulfatase-like hydrolase/transferase [Pseudomonas sp. GWSMS-1]|uniref:sulfatase-like hydrolase/transferase n=1 Tax=Pseudomonas sp. GWSMS-1 TaxID=3308997 RepID=UPI003CEE643C